MSYTKGKWDYTVLDGTQIPATLFVTCSNGNELDVAVFEKWEMDWAKEEMQANARRICQCVNNFDGLLVVSHNLAETMAIDYAIKKLSTITDDNFAIGAATILQGIQQQAKAAIAATETA